MTDVNSTESSGLLNDESDEDASEAQAQIIASLRTQVTDLFSQVTQLNGKLVASYDRVSDLEDQLHDTSSSLRNATVTISSLELERSHHLAALNTGLLVEKAHVTAELNRLMERATEEAAQRGQAESARRDIEKDLDDLSASLFDQANTMVAEARLNRAKSERKLQDAEQALKIAEDAVKDMQLQMQSLQAEKEVAERDAHEAKLTMGKGKWIERDDLRAGEVPRIRFMITHTAYAEFVAFLTHLRGLRVSQPVPPVISMLLNQPFLARLLTEDSEPTIRLDLAPSLNWLSRRSVLAAIHTGMLTVEPLPFSSLAQELHQHPQSMTAPTLSCALCGTLIARLPTTPVSRSQTMNGGSWFKYPRALGTSQNHTPQPPECEPPGQVYVFRLTPATTSSSPSVPAPLHTSSVSLPVIGTSSRPPLNAITSSRVLPAQTQTAPYALCTSNYCLARLRSTCSLWAFVRVGIMERIWEEELVQPPKPIANGNIRETPSLHMTAGTGNQSTSSLSSTSEKPPIPPRRRKLWEMASALGERAVGWGKENGESTKEKEKDKEKNYDGPRKLPAPPPSHPSALHPHAESPTPTTQVEEQVPPPLPKRNVVRGTTTVDTVDPLSGIQNATPEVRNPETVFPKANGYVNAGKPELNKAEHSKVDSSPIDEITPAGLSSDYSPPPSIAPMPAAAEPGIPVALESSGSESTALETTVPEPGTQDRLPSPSPNTIPLPTTPTTPSAVQRVTSPAPRPRSRVSSPASPPPSSRPASPARTLSRAGSPAPATVARTTPSSPGYPPSVSHIRGKTSMSSPLASSRPTSPALTTTGPGAPPLPRRAAARRAVPLPPTFESPKVIGEGTKEEVSTVIAATESTLGTDEKHKASDAKASGERKSSVAEKEGERTAEVVVNEVIPPQIVSAPTGGDVVEEVIATSEPGVDHITAPQAMSASTTDNGNDQTTVPQDATIPTPEVLEPAKDVTIGNTNGLRDSAEGMMNGTSATAVSDPLPLRASESDGYASVDTTSTKQSSSTEDEGFASDATWEERTWKEVVRLKEAMFWARIGGIRTLEG